MRLNSIAAVVLNWNQSQLTLDCIDCLRRQTRPVDRFIVVDNGSRPEQRTLLSQLAGDVQLVPLTSNHGFAGGMNAGIRAALDAGADAVWLLNNDAFPEPDCLQVLSATMEADETLGAITPRLVGTDGTEEHAGGCYDIVADTNRLMTARDLSTPVGPSGYWLNGPAPLVRAAALRKAGLFDDHYFAYWEEVDLFFRFVQHGFRLQAVPTVTTLHLGGSTSGGRQSPFYRYMILRNRIRLVRKHAPVHGRTARIVSDLRRQLKLALAFAEQHDDVAATAITQGILATVTRETGAPKWLGYAPKLITTGLHLLNGVSHRMKQFRSLLSRSPRPVKSQVVQSQGTLASGATTHAD